MTAETKAAPTFTPGPWQVHPSDACLVVKNVDLTNIKATRIVDTAGTVWTRAQLVGNARLIAAAPDLYAALTSLYHAFINHAASGECAFGGDDGLWSEAERASVRAAEAAIAKAAGL